MSTEQCNGSCTRPPPKKVGCPKGTKMRKRGGDLVEHIARYSVQQPSGCVYWTRGHVNGRPVISVNGKLKKVTRVLWELVRGTEVPPMLRHTCDNPKCIRVTAVGGGGHLIPGDAFSNAMDRFIAGRSNPVRGDKHGNARLTDEQVAELRAAYAAGGVSYSDLSDSYHISIGHVGRIVRGERWRA